jgi:hypothetical protein
MKDIGRKTSKMDMELSLGLMELHMKENINKERNVGSESSSGLTGRFTMDNLLIIISMEREFILGEIRDSISETGRIIRWMGPVFLHGPIRENIKESIKMIRKMDMVFLNGESYF